MRGTICSEIEENGASDCRGFHSKKRRRLAPLGPRLFVCDVIRSRGRRFTLVRSSPRRGGQFTLVIRFNRDGRIPRRRQTETNGDKRRQTKTNEADDFRAAPILVGLEPDPASPVSPGEASLSYFSFAFLTRSRRRIAVPSGSKTLLSSASLFLGIALAGSIANTSRSSLFQL